MTEEGLEARYGPNSTQVERLLSDARVLGPSGIERIAWARRHLILPAGQAEAAEVEARGVVSAAGLERAWEAAESDLRGMVEGHYAQQSWQAEDPVVDRTAEDAALNAILALVVKEELGRDEYRALVKPMADALPWLLPEETPGQYRPSET
ncbi:MAG: hypothetical protein J2P39_01820 [Candidatus Dormibacteraeota bacterium]|nr:hypothetical protein [Candidatus Dormibacteraeota bacterium]